MKHIYIYIYIIAILTLSSCESVIPFEYNSISPLHTVQANFALSDSLCIANVYISSTRDVEEICAEEAVADAVVEITTPQGEVIPLYFDGDSLYVAQIRGLDTTPEQGDYTISVAIGEQSYNAACALTPPAELLEPIFYWQDFMMDMGVLMMKAMIADPAGESNYYRYAFILPDGETYQNGVTSDSSMDGYTLELYAQFNPDEELGYFTMPDEMAGSLHKLYIGDVITINIEQIDKRAYDYFSTLGLSTSNPVCSFEGGCLGYFSVSTTASLEYTFTAESITVL